MPLDLTDDKSTLVQVMAWCRQATSHYLSQCWPSCMSPYGITRPQWVKIIVLSLLLPRKLYQCRHCLHMRNFNSDLEYFLIFRCIVKLSQHVGCRGHVNMACNHRPLYTLMEVCACNQWLETVHHLLHVAFMCFSLLMFFHVFYLFFFPRWSYSHLPVSLVSCLLDSNLYGTTSSEEEELGQIWSCCR